MRKVSKDNVGLNSLDNDVTVQVDINIAFLNTAQHSHSVDEGLFFFFLIETEISARSITPKSY